MKYPKVLLSIFLLAILVSYVHCDTFAWKGNNYYEHHESWPLGLYHYFTVQIQASYNDGGYHYARGYWYVTGGYEGPTYISTGYANGPSDSRILGVYNYAYQDFWDFSHGDDPVSTNGGVRADKVPYGSNVWPVGINDHETE